MTDLSKAPRHLIAWHGISLTVPEDWNIGAIGGDLKEGYLRLDGSDMPRVEIKWAKVGSGHVDIPGLVEKYLRDLQKGKKNQTKVQRDVQLTGRRKARHKSGLECFGWQSETQGMGAAWYCPDCEKTVIVQVMGTLDEPLAKLAEPVIQDLEDHPLDDWLTWSTYGFTCQTPERFKLGGQKLMAGLIELDLACENERLHVARWGMANVALRNTTLKEWGQKELGKRLKKFLVDLDVNEYRGHERLTLSGRSNLPQEKVAAFAQHCLGKPYPDRVLAHLWHCKDENKLFYVEAVLDREQLGMVEELCDRLPCHGGRETQTEA